MAAFSCSLGDLSVKGVDMAEIDAVMELQRAVYSAMPVKSHLVLTTEEEIRETIDLDLCIGVYKDSLLAAVTTVIGNRKCGRNVGGILGYDPLECVTYDTTFVHPDFRGLGIQRKLMPFKDSFSIDIGAKFAFATVAPENTYSLNNVLASGFEILEKREMYSGFQRYVLRKKLYLTEGEN